MKIISSDAGDTPVTNVEVLAWLKEKNFQVGKEQLSPKKIWPPKNTVALATSLQKYLECSPSAHVSVESLHKLFEKLGPYKLRSPELLMIANIRPEAYAHLTPLIADVYSRYTEDQLAEILEIVNSTLEPRTRGGTAPEETENDAAEDDESEPLNEPEAEEDIIVASPGAKAEMTFNDNSKDQPVEDIEDASGKDGTKVPAGCTNKAKQFPKAKTAKRSSGRKRSRNRLDARVTDLSAQPPPQSVNSMSAPITVKMTPDGRIDAASTDVSSLP